MKQITPILVAAAVMSLSVAHADQFGLVNPAGFVDAEGALVAQAAPPARPQRNQPDATTDRPRGPNADRRPAAPVADPEPWLQVQIGRAHV